MFVHNFSKNKFHNIGSFYFNTRSGLCYFLFRRMAQFLYPNDIGYPHCAVNRSINFVNLKKNQMIHTQNIEWIWRILKDFFPDTG